MGNKRASFPLVTNDLSARSPSHPEKLTVAGRIKKFLAFLGTRMLSALFTRARYCPRVLYLEDTLNSLLQMEASGQFYERAALSPGNGLPLPIG